jgi:hypothetical protein
MTSSDRARSAAHRGAFKARARRSFDGVVASYLRELRAADGTVRRHSLSGERAAART